MRPAEHETVANQDDEVDVQIDESSYDDVDSVVKLLEGFWGAEKDPDKLFSIITEKETEFYEALQRRGLFSMWRLAYSHYFGLFGASGSSSNWQTQSISFSGEDGELLEFCVNEFRSFCDQIFNMASKNRPSFQAQAINTDYKSLSQVESADTMVQYYYEQVFGERKEKEVVKSEGLYGKGYTHVEWDEDGGRTVTVNEDVEIPTGGTHPVPTQAKAGEFIITRLWPWQVACEPYRSEIDQHLWRLVTDQKRSKWEMMAKYPLFATKIDESSYAEVAYEYIFPGTDPAAREPEGQCAVRIFYHAKSGAMPNGRKCVFVNDVLCFDGPLPIDDLPVIPLCAAELHGTSFGISDLWNLIPLEQMENQVLSDIATNLEAFGRPPLALPEGSDFDIDSMANGQSIIWFPGTVDQLPQTIKYPAIPEASFKSIDMFRQLKQSISGLNAVARGDTTSNIQSGAHAALYSQIAVEAQSDRSLNLDLHRERIGNLIISYLKAFAKHPQLVAVAGVDERSYLQEFTQKDFDGIERVRIITANPALRTQAGRMQLIELLMDSPGQPIRDPAQIVTFLSSGQWKEMISPVRSMEMRIKWENEALLKGPEVTQVPGDIDPTTGEQLFNKTVALVPAMMTDNAAQHITNHLTVLNSPAARANPKVRDAVLAHVMEHVMVSRNGDVYLAQLLNNPPPQEAMMQGAQTPQAGAGANGSGATPAQKNQAQPVLSPPDETDDSKGAGVPAPSKPPAQAASM